MSALRAPCIRVGDAEPSVPGEISIDGMTFRPAIDDLHLPEAAEPS